MKNHVEINCQTVAEFSQLQLLFRYSDIQWLWLSEYNSLAGRIPPSMLFVQMKGLYIIIFIHLQVTIHLISQAQSLL